MVKEPANQNGRESSKTNKKHFRGDLLRDVVVIEESSSTDYGNGGIRGPLRIPARLDRNSLNPNQQNLILAAVVELRRPRRLVVDDVLRDFQSSDTLHFKQVAIPPQLLRLHVRRSTASYQTSRTHVQTREQQTHRCPLEVQPLWLDCPCEGDVFRVGEME